MHTSSTSTTTHSSVYRWTLWVLVICLLYVPNMGDNVNKPVTYEEIKAIQQHPEKYLIEVRSREELEETGEIPGSVNVPLPELKEALESGDEAYKTKYGREKPEKGTEIIFTCRSGRRATTAAGIASELGYSNTRIYHGSWLEWAEKEGLKS